jgi:16S rRNA processing protein RimM
MTPAPSGKRDLQNSGSPRSGEPVYLTIGKLRRTHGVKGEILMDVLADDPEMIKPGLTLYVGTKHKEAKLAAVRAADKSLIVRFESHTDCDQAAVFRNQFVAIKTSDAQPLNTGRYYHHEVIGLKAVDESGKQLGILTDIISTGANDVYVIKPLEGAEILVPAVKEFVIKIDPGSHLIVVRLPEWE